MYMNLTFAFVLVLTSRKRIIRFLFSMNNHSILTYIRRFLLIEKVKKNNIISFFFHLVLIHFFYYIKIINMNIRDLLSNRKISVELEFWVTEKFDRNTFKYKNEGSFIYVTTFALIGLTEIKKYFKMTKYQTKPVSKMTGDDLIVGIVIYLFIKKDIFGDFKCLFFSSNNLCESWVNTCEFNFKIDFNKLTFISIEWSCFIGGTSICNVHNRVRKIVYSCM